VSSDPLAQVAADPSAACVLVDFDGSLAPIVPDPASARPLPAARAALERLVPLVARVGVISGRPVEFLDEQLPVAGVELAGLYGLVRRVEGRHEVEPRAEPYRQIMEQAAVEADAMLPGILVERKGLTLAFHWRQAPDRQREVEDCARELADRYELGSPHPGKMSVELKPPIAMDKGDAVELFCAGMRHAAFAGDDLGDLPAFERLARLVASGALDDAVRIGVHSSEAPSGLLEQTDVVVDGPDGLAVLLNGLADRIEAG